MIVTFAVVSIPTLPDEVKLKVSVNDEEFFDRDPIPEDLQDRRCEITGPFP